MFLSGCYGLHLRLCFGVVLNCLLKNTRNYFEVIANCFGVVADFGAVVDFGAVADFGVVEQCEVLPQCIADWVDGRIAVSSYYM